MAASEDRPAAVAVLTPEMVARRSLTIVQEAMLPSTGAVLMMPRKPLRYSSNIRCTNLRTDPDGHTPLMKPRLTMRQLALNYF